MLIAIGVVVVLTLVGALVYIGLREDRDRDPLQERLAEFGERELPQSLEEVELSMSFSDRVIVPLVNVFARITTSLTPEKQIQEARRKLEVAGLAGQVQPAVFIGMRVVLAAAFPIMFFMVFFVFAPDTFGRFVAMAITVGSGALGYFMPDLYVGSKISRRQNEIVKALPDALDLLTICVEAGLGFDAAMGKVYEKWENDLALAFGRVLREIQLGRARREALRDMSDRLDVPDLTTFVAAVIQADSLGVSMSQILRVQSDQMRVKRRQRAQEKAQQAPVKMMIPLAFLIFPSMYIVLLGPAILGVMESGALNSLG